MFYIMYICVCNWGQWGQATGAQRGSTGLQTAMESHLQCHDVLEVVGIPALDRPVLAGREEEVCVWDKLGEEGEERLEVEEGEEREQ